MYLLTKQLPYTKVENKVSNSSYVLNFIFEEPQISLTIHTKAKMLVDHMTIVEESRKLIKGGKVMSWKEFAENENK